MYQSLSYWEQQTWFSAIDFTVVGSGIVGLSCALKLRELYPKAKIVVLEKGMLPQGASTKNAGFACFGSISEISSDLKSHTPEEVISLAQQRFNGITQLRSQLGDSLLDYHQLGGHEVFLNNQKELFDSCRDQLREVNKMLSPVFGGAPFVVQENTFGFSGVQPQYITQRFEGQINTGRMMQGLLKKAQQNDIFICNGVAVKNFEDNGTSVHVKTDTFVFNTSTLCIATNGFAKALLKEQVTPARAQVLITKPIPNLSIQGTFHFDEGYYYFRNIDDRILFGGGRNLDIAGETTTDFGVTEHIQQQLKSLLSTVILPHTPYEIDSSWSGVMGVGHQKKPIVKAYSKNVFCGVRLGGMGIAIGSKIGADLAGLHQQ